MSRTLSRTIALPGLALAAALLWGLLECAALCRSRLRERRSR